MMGSTCFNRRVDERRWTRRGVIAAAGAALGGAFVARASARPLRFEWAEAPQAGAHHYVSRPDLRPPPVAVATPAAGTADGLLFLAPFQITGKAGRGYGALIVDETGEPVWFKPEPKLTAMDLRVQRYRGRSVLTWYEGDVLGAYGGEYVIADSGYRELARVRAGRGEHGDLHEFLITSRSTALISIYRVRSADLTSVGGPADGKLVEGLVQEIDIPTGRVLFEWSSADHIGVDESYMTNVTKAGTVDYFHLNSIGVDLDGNLIVSARHTSAVYKVDRRTGEILWRLGGKKSDFTMLPGADFAFQHDVRRHADGTLTLFDNNASLPPAAGAAPTSFSRPMRIALDMTAMTASLVTVYQPPEPRLGWAMGNVQQLPDGGVFVGWGTAGSFTEFTPDGQVRFDAALADGSVTYRAFRYAWVGRPDGRPAIGVTPNGDGTATVHASWNGATEVARWQVRGGAHAAKLRRLQTAQRAGFETAITVPAASGFVAVAALDAHGRELGVSRLARV